METDNQMYDLHGLSEAEAESTVLKALRRAQGNKKRVLRFVTGRGNHVNSKGNRGTLFNEFPSWIERSQYAARVSKINCFDGHYEVHVKAVQLDDRCDKSIEKLYHVLMGNQYDTIKERALAGHPEDMYLYARLLEDGDCCDQDIKLSVVFLEKAANANYPMAMHEYARYWLFGIGVKQSDEQAQKWLWRAHEKGFIPSTVTLAKGYAWATPGYQYDFQKAYDLHQVGAKGGNVDSMRFFASIHRDGQGGVLKSLRLSFAWYKKAADLGDPKSQYNVAVSYHKGQGVEKNPQESARYFALSAQGGDSDAQFMHAMNLLATKQKNMCEQGVMWLFTAADNGSEQANAYILRTGNDSDNKEFLIRSAKAGNFYSQLKLDKLRGNERTLQDITIKEISARFKMLTDNGIKLMNEHAKYFLLDSILLRAKAKYKRRAYLLIEEMIEGQCELAMRRKIYFSQIGDSVLQIKKDSSVVEQLLLESIKLKDPKAMVDLSMLYQAQNKQYHIATIKKLLRQAAEGQYPPACYYLGLLYELGDFGPNKYRQALQCFKAALKYETNVKKIAHFSVGIIDEYQPVSALANSAIERVQQMIKQPTALQQHSTTIKLGFFNSGAQPIIQETNPGHRTNEFSPTKSDSESEESLDKFQNEEKNNDGWSCILQ